MGWAIPPSGMARTTAVMSYLTVHTSTVSRMATEATKQDGFTSINNIADLEEISP